MSQSHPNEGGVGGEISLAAGLLTHTATTAPLPGKYVRRWRRYLVVGIFLSIRKTRGTTHADSDEVSASSPYAPLPPSPTPCSQQLPTTPYSTPPHHVININSGNENTTVDQDSIFKAVKERDLSSLKRNGGVEKFASILGSNLVTGISFPERGLRLQNTGPVQTEGFLLNFLKAWKSRSILLLLIIAGLSFAIEFREQGPQYGWHDGVAILVAVFLLVNFRSVSKFCLERKLQKKQQEKRKLRVEVVRNAECRQITVSDLVMGDLVRLKEDDMVPADGLFVNGDGLVLDEVSSSRIVGDENPFLSYGSRVIEGSGRMLVISEGAGTASHPEKRTFLAAQIEKSNSFTEILALLFSLLIAVFVLIGLLLRGQHKNDDILPELKGNATIDLLIKVFEDMFWRPRGRVHILAGALIAIVIGMQHGMPFVITVSLSFWNEKVEFAGAKPQNLSACGIMGLVTVICVDATGGMTEVKEFFIGEENMSHSFDSKSHQVVHEALCQAIGASSLVPEMSLSPTQLAIASWANSLGIGMKLTEQCFSVIDHGRLSNTNCSRLLVEEKENDNKILHMHLEGDASTILKLCSHYYNSRGEVHAIKDERSNIEKRLTSMEKRGLKVLAFACKQVETLESSEEGSRLLAVVGLKSHKTIQDLRNTGVKIILVSRDAVSEVRKIACEFEIIPPGSNHVELDGEQIRDLSCAERLKIIEEATVIGSCRAEDMLLVVESLQEKDHVVAFFGGLTTREIQALEKADVGLTKDTLSTEMTRKISDIVIYDEHSLLQVMKFGRCAYNNIQKFTQLQLAACISGSSISLIAAICLWDSPLTPIQLIWINFVTCLLGGLMMTMELRSENLMANPPASRRTQPLITKGMWIKTATQVLSQTCLLMVLHLVGQGIIPRINEEIWKPLVFNSFMFCQVLNHFNSMGMLRKETIGAIRQHQWLLLARQHKWRLLAGGSVMSSQVILVMWGKSLAGFRSLNLMHLLLSFTVAALSWGLGIALEFISNSFSNWFSTSHGRDHIGFSRRNRRLIVSMLIGPPSLLFVFALYTFTPMIINPSTLYI